MSDRDTCQAQSWATCLRSPEKAGVLWTVSGVGEAVLVLQVKRQRSREVRGPVRQGGLQHEWKDPAISLRLVFFLVPTLMTNKPFIHVAAYWFPTVFMRNCNTASLEGSKAPCPGTQPQNLVSFQCFVRLCQETWDVFCCEVGTSASPCPILLHSERLPTPAALAIPLREGTCRAVGRLWLRSAGRRGGRMPGPSLQAVPGSLFSVELASENNDISFPSGFQSTFETVPSQVH
ncbi:hypothetical protein HJG60_007818 [Phyllostomus discolor]|uniref:Uncharacterized protein n=1 Tax=Phyllostomus discolor TaxID=89673 RepID=A0A834BHC4_9CHIR|nr:hypothetical protein HJG60_007818 [Phyllostomus discolor]